MSYIQVKKCRVWPNELFHFQSTKSRLDLVQVQGKDKKICRYFHVVEKDSKIRRIGEALRGVLEMDELLT